jgi:hypothetical protein
LSAWKLQSQTEKFLPSEDVLVNISVEGEIGWLITLKEVALIIGTGAGTALNILWSSMSEPLSSQSPIFVRNAKKRKTTATAKYSSTSIFLIT